MSDADSLPVGIVRLDANRIVTAANDWFAAWTGRPASDIVGHPVDDFLRAADDDLFPAGVGPGPWVMLDPRDSSRAVMVTRHWTDEEDVLMLSEASERWHALGELRRRHALADRTRTRLELVMDSSVAFSTATTEERLADVLAETARQAYRAEHTSVYLHRDDGSAALTAGEDPLGGGIPYESLIALVSAPRRIVKVEGVAEAEALLPGAGAHLDAAGVRAFIAAPLHHDERDFGAYISWFQHERTFDDEAEPLAEALAGQAAQALATLRLQTRLSHAATHDDVTGLPNRRLLETELAAMIGRAGCAVMFLDLDGFKEVNDRLGHHAGDGMLREAGQRLVSAVREGDLVARYGGDEFVIACRTDDSTAVPDIAQRVLESLRGEPGDATLGRRLSASIGIAFGPPGSGLTAEQLIRHADRAMYLAKTAGGDRVSLAESTAPEPAPEEW